MEEKKQFLCGVVEGFYGRPWSMDQRKVLFQWMQHWGLNTYLYGPKDDLKHRLLWREVYSPEEEGQLRTLIVEAKSRGLRFVYALSPGQDIVFSSSCDLTLLKRKLRQVSDLGCQAFAILFDDIDHSMCQADSEAFSSFAHAQVTVTNEIYRFLGEPPVFLFCPTEYCGSLCSPSISKSPYLQTVGEDLLPDITVVWTGSKVISRKLSVHCLAEVESVLQRPPLIWDNLHANDYDSRRLFLGPFKGREPQLRSHLRGLLLNPNCEFEANYIPLHTLGSWYRAEKEERKDEECEYCPDRALSAALHDWMEELNQPLQAGRQSTRADQRSSATASRCKTPDRSDCPSTLRGTSTVAKLPVFPLNSSSPPSSPTKVNGEREAQDGEKKRSNNPSQPNHQPPGSRPEAPSGGGRGTEGPGSGRLWWEGPSQRIPETAAGPDLAENKLPPCRHEQQEGAASEDGRVLSDSSTLGTWKNCFHWCGKSSGADLLGVESEPWVFKGGVSGEVQLELYRMVRQLHLRTQGGQESSIAHPDIIGDRCLGPCLALCPEYSFILEDELGVCGCVLGILDVRSFAKRCQASWMPAMRDKYPHKGGNTHPNTQDLIQLMEEDQGEYPDSLLYHFPSQLRLDALPELVDISVSRTLLTALLTALKANGKNIVSSHCISVRD
ncbi:Protein O-GlcNAcase [Larimichthys crocea]|uniref:Uncharacterized protein n=1 Tax=Larimichthys crocea TaxID=215358 RepID=A0ACD3Q598_LARCR|nr:Protein O-GlcNAcase [Larimichthys crocea]